MLDRFNRDIANDVTGLQVPRRFCDAGDPGFPEGEVFLYIPNREKDLAAKKRTDHLHPIHL